MNDNKGLVEGRGRQLMAPDNKTRLLACWAASGLSARAFAQEAGVAAHHLYDWRRAARRWAPAEVPLVEVPRQRTASGWVAEVVTRSGPVQLSSAAAPAWAAQLVRELNRC